MMMRRGCRETSMNGLMWVEGAASQLFVEVHLHPDCKVYALKCIAHQPSPPSKV